MKMLKDLWNYILSLWNVWGGIIVSILIGKAVDYEKVRMDRAVSLILLVLTIVSVLTFIKKAFVGKKLTKAETLIVATQKSVANLDTSLSPIVKGEVLGEKIIETQKITRKVGEAIMKKVKAILKWLCLYWQQWVGLLITYVVAVYTYYCLALDKLNWLFEWLPKDFGWVLSAKIFIGVVVALGVALITRNQCKWVGVGTNEKCKEYKEHLQELIEAGVPQLSSSAKSTLKSALKEAQNQLKLAEAKLSSLKKKAKQIETDIINNQALYEVLKNDSTSQLLMQLQEQYSKAVDEVSQKQNEISKLNADIENLTNALS